MYNVFRVILVILAFSSCTQSDGIIALDEADDETVLSAPSDNTGIGGDGSDFDFDDDDDDPPTSSIDNPTVKR